MKLKLFAFLALASATVASAAETPSNLLGATYLQLEASHIRLSDTGLPSSMSGYHGGATANFAAVTEGFYHVDAILSYGYANVSGNSITARGHDLSGGLRFWLPLEAVQPFLGASTGYGWTRTRVGGVNLPGNDDSWIYGFEAGVQVPFSDSLTMVYTAGWDRHDKSRESAFTFGAQIQKWFERGYGIGLGYSITEGSVKTHMGTLSMQIPL